MCGARSCSSASHAAALPADGQAAAQAVQIFNCGCRRIQAHIRTPWLWPLVHAVTLVPAEKCMLGWGAKPPSSRLEAGAA